LDQGGLMDFDDLILRALELDWGGRFQAALADEFQDLSLAQVTLLDRLAPPGALTVIGDPDQSVYAFRGALPDAFERLKEVRGRPARLDLSLNFRSNPAICLAAEALRPPGALARASGRKVPMEAIGRAAHERPWDEALWVAGRIRAHLGVTDLGPGGGSRFDAEAMPLLGLSDIAVLFRLRQQGEEIGRALDEAGLPWQMAGEAEITAADHLDFAADKISLLTMHAAKGLEFRLVFVTGLEEGLCPLSLEGLSLPADEGEERRLLYVALTRAKDKLYLTRARYRTVFGRKLSGAPSPWWDAAPESIVAEHRGKAAAKRPQPKTRLF
jgi:DNA helicase-2/ATP-dependent DNA helicase PcrA